MASHDGPDHRGAARLEASGVIVYRVDAADDIATTIEGVGTRLALPSRRRIAVLLLAEAARRQELRAGRASGALMLNRRDAVKRLLRDRGGLIVVPGLGSPAYDVAACGDDALDFPLWGGMGGAAMLGLGLALGTSRPPRRSWSPATARCSWASAASRPSAASAPPT